MKLSEILNLVNDDKKKGLICIDDWKFNDAAHLQDMGFEFDGDFVMSLKDPPMKVYKKNQPNGEWFYLEEEDKGIQIFQEFEQVIKYFDTYSQPDIDKEMN